MCKLCVHEMCQRAFKNWKDKMSVYVQMHTVAGQTIWIDDLFGTHNTFLYGFAMFSIRFASFSRSIMFLMIVLCTLEPFCCFLHFFFSPPFSVECPFSTKHYHSQVTIWSTHWTLAEFLSSMNHNDRTKKTTWTKTTLCLWTVDNAIFLQQFFF